MPVIKIGGAKKPATRSTSKPKPAAKRGTAKPAQKRTTAKKTTATNGRKTAKKPAAKKTTTERKPRAIKVEPRLLKQHEKALKAAGEKRAKAEQMHREAVDAIFTAAQAAMEDEVPMGFISDTTGVSRQWLYKMGSFRERANGNGSGSKARAKKAVASKAKPRSSKPAAKKATSTKRRVRARAS